MGLFPTDAVNDQEVTNANGTTFRYVLADDKWIIVNDLTVSNDAYDEGTWNDNSDAATKDAIRDKFESLSAPNHNDLPGLNDGDVYEHLSAAQVTALHAKQHAMDSATYHTSSDIVTLNSSTTKHGFLKKLDDSAINFMNGQGNWAVPPGGGIGTLDQVFDQGKIIDGANSEANAVQIGEATDRIKFWHDGSNSYVKNSAGQLKIYSASNILFHPNGLTADYINIFGTTSYTLIGSVGGNLYIDSDSILYLRADATIQINPTHAQGVAMNFNYYSSYPTMYSSSSDRVYFYNGSAYMDCYGDFKDQASKITKGTFEKIKKVKDTDGIVDYDTLPEEIQIEDTLVYELEEIDGIKDYKRDELGNKIKKKDIDGNDEIIKTTDIGDMMYFNFSAIKELVDKIDALEARILELEEK